MNDADEQAEIEWYSYQTHLAVEEAVRAERERVLGEVEALIRASPTFRITLNDFMYWRHECSK
jgi:hypothetical protein